MWESTAKTEQRMQYALCVFLSSSRLYCLIWVLLWPEIRPLWPRQGLVLLCHDASIAPCACLLPGPKTICCKLRYGLFRLMCCLRTWCDWVSIHTTTLKLPASWPQTPMVTASVQDRKSAMAWVCVCERIPPLCSLILTLSSLERTGLEIKTTEPSCCAASRCHSHIYSNLTRLWRKAVHSGGILQTLYEKQKTCKHLLFIKMPVIFARRQFFNLLMF